MPAGTSSAEISLRLPAAGPVIAVAVITEVMSVPELVMNDFDPLITHSSPSSRAVVRVAPASLPPPASVSPNAASAVPAHSAGSQRCRCSSLPNR